MADPDAHAVTRAVTRALSAYGLCLAAGGIAAWLVATPFLLPLALALAANLVTWRAGRRMQAFEDSIVPIWGPGAWGRRPRGRVYWNGLQRWQADQRLEVTGVLTALGMGLTALLAAAGWAARGTDGWKEPPIALAMGFELGVVLAGMIGTAAVVFQNTRQPLEFVMPPKAMTGRFILRSMGR